VRMAIVGMAVCVAVMSMALLRRCWFMGGVFVWCMLVGRVLVLVRLSMAFVAVLACRVIVHRGVSVRIHAMTIGRIGLADALLIVAVVQTRRVGNGLMMGRAVTDMRLLVAGLHRAIGHSSLAAMAMAIAVAAAVSAAVPASVTSAIASTALAATTATLGAALGACVGFRISLGLGRGLLVDQRLPIGHGDLVVVGVDFVKGEEAVAVAAVFDECGLQRRLNARHLGKVYAAAQKFAGGTFIVKFFYAALLEYHDPGLFRVGGIDEHLVGFIVHETVILGGVVRARDPATGVVRSVKRSALAGQAAKRGCAPLWGLKREPITALARHTCRVALGF
jgi:hypothetical protein